MTGSLAAQITIPIVAFILLGTWLAMVYHADSHPGWRGRSQAPPEHITQLPSQAAATAAETGTTLRIPAQSTDSPEPGQPTESSRAVPGQRRPTSYDEPVSAAGASAAAGARADQPPPRRGALPTQMVRICAAGGCAQRPSIKVESCLQIW